MLPRCRRPSEPGVIGDVDQKIRSPEGKPSHQIGENNLVTDQRRDRGQALQVQGSRAGTSRKIRRSDGNFRESDNTAKGHVLAKGDEMKLIISAGDAGLVVDGVQAVPDLVCGPAFRPDPGRAGNRQPGPLAGPAGGCYLSANQRHRRCYVENPAKKVFAVLPGSPPIPGQPFGPDGIEIHHRCR